MIKKISYLRWQMWEIIYKFTYWLFAEHPVTWGVKHSRNMAYTEYCLPNRGGKWKDIFKK
ncbi:hypothetical protein [Salmonella phage SSBI34]|nr:hypothetical protein [Salmonella phage SSBI34]